MVFIINPLHAEFIKKIYMYLNSTEFHAAVMPMSVHAKAKIDNILPLLYMYSEYIGVWLSHGLLVI